LAQLCGGRFPVRFRCGGFRIRSTSIKVTLIHNPTAGKGSQPTREELVKLLRAAGHKVQYQSSKEKKWDKILKKPGDLVAVAGGDGTVSKVARRLIGSPTPIAILPIGTANNIASSLGIAGRKLKDLVATWKAAQCVHFDAGVAKGPWGSKHFVEGFGLGLFAETMFQIESSKQKELPETDHVDEEINAILKILKGQLRNFKPSDLTVRLDGADISGQYVLLEALNIKYIGPNLNLAPQADTKDGFLDIITVPHRKRAELSKYLAARIDGEEPSIKLPSRRGRHLQIEWESTPVHIDDLRWPKNHKAGPIKSHAITIKVDPGALVFLMPPEKRGRRQPRT
jgi:diacylglycerol kinase family enzyme